MRLTYDIAIPEPGLEILRKLEAIDFLKKQLEAPFEFNINPTLINTDPNSQTYYLKLAQTYSVAVDEPPTVTPFEDDIPLSGENVGGAIEVDIGEDYETSHTTDGRLIVMLRGGRGNYAISIPTVISTGEVRSSHYDTNDDTSDKMYEFRGKRGKFYIPYSLNAVGSGIIYIRFDCNLTEDGIRRWQLRVWEKLRDAAKVKYEENKQMFQQRLDVLMKDIEADDPLSLRKKEREEIMKGVLRWFLGPELFKLNQICIKRTRK